MLSGPGILGRPGGREAATCLLRGGMAKYWQYEPDALQVIHAEIIDGCAFRLGEVDGLPRGNVGLSEWHLQ